MTPDANDPTPMIDERAIATGVATRFVDRLLAAAEEKVRTLWAKRKKNQTAELMQFISAQSRRYRQIKNILYYNEPVELESLYVPLYFSTNPHALHDRRKLKKSTSDEDILKQFKDPTKLIICATAGAGKSFFMRKALMTLTANSETCSDRIPIFFELRNLNGKPKTSIISAISAHIQEHAPSFMPEQFRLGLENGLFVLLLDGYDEIETEKTNHYEQELIALSRQNPSTSIIISTRPMDSIFAWQDFSVQHILPLTKASAIDLINRLHFDESVKAKFIEATKRDLYEKHQSFMSTPLLVTMMLLTFSETAEIDTRLTTFYNDAFHALFVRHDAKKEAFRRTLASRLSRDAFESIFAAFCFLTYSANQYQFQEDEAYQQIRRASELQEQCVAAELLFQDFCVTSCMLIKEGTRYVFSHRSFQEYFTAVFIDRCPQDIAVAMLRELTARADRDNVIGLLLELNPELVETQWVLPRLKPITRLINNLDPQNLTVEFARAFFNVDDVTFGADGKDYWAIGPKGRMGANLLVIFQLYGIDIFHSFNTKTLENAMRETSSRPKSRIPGSARILFPQMPRQDSDDEIPNIIKFLQSLQHRIETSYARRKSKLEQIIASTKLGASGASRNA
jgi:hypothetical protein